MPIPTINHPGNRLAQLGQKQSSYYLYHAEEVALKFLPPMHEGMGGYCHFFPIIIGWLYIAQGINPRRKFEKVHSSLHIWREGEEDIGPIIHQNEGSFFPHGI